MPSTTVADFWNSVFPPKGRHGRDRDSAWSRVDAALDHGVFMRKSMGVSKSKSKMKKSPSPRKSDGKGSGKGNAVNIPPRNGPMITCRVTGYHRRRLLLDDFEDTWDAKDEARWDSWCEKEKGERGPMMEYEDGDSDCEWEEIKIVRRRRASTEKIMSEQ